ncbi:MAG: parallel beta-helix domain-containing protein, partial [Amphiplicatus sp.]
NNRAEYNVAGIEIENTVAAEVYGNIATNHTGGILVFNMPALQQAGYGVRVYDNDVFENNTKNFGHPGTPVASVPAGSGVVINSHDAVEIFNNKVANNKTANVIISSLFSTGYSDSSMSETFDPYPEGVYIYGNAFEGGGDAPDGNDLKLLKVAKFGLNGSFPDILWDGYQDKNKQVDGALPVGLRICVDNSDAEVLNVDGPNKYKDPRVEKAPFECALERLKPVELG